ncbi:ParB N-terminal domain-containing protein [Paenibacillus sp. FSL P4-0176]|uniref:ParB/RepB/Spo0J family partition protein n=1 Tax=Paenibacillus sp. FSL P4-0176 TaxID=2921631 RepID=UPI0030CB2395
MGTININKLNPHPKNDFYFTDITGDKYEEIKRSIDTYGIRDPLKVTTAYTIISGHQRYRIANDLGLLEVPVEIMDVDEWQAEYMLIAENTERRGEAESDPVKKGRQGAFLKEYWKAGKGRKNLMGPMVLIKDIAESMGESERTMKRLIKLNDLIPEIQTLVSVGSIGVRAAEQLAYLTEEEQTSLFNLKEGNIDKLTLEESKQIRTEIENLRDTNQLLQDTITSLKEDNIPKVVHRDVIKEVVPEHVTAEIKRLKEQYEATQNNEKALQSAIGNIQREKESLERYIESDDFELLNTQKKEALLKSQAHVSMFELQIKIQKFLKEAAPSLYLQGAMACVDRTVKRELLEAAKALEEYTNNLINYVGNIERQQVKEVIDVTEYEVN